jgi:hypothetical protein
MYEVWLRETVARVVARRAPEERLIFINAWNEWAEGAYLEPDRRYAHQYLEATRRALLLACQEPGLRGAQDEDISAPVEQGQPPRNVNVGLA